MAIRIEHLNKSFDSQLVVRDVSFSVNEGEFVTLLGPSGSGKSTILRCLAGLEDPDAGAIFIADEDVTHTPVQERQIGFVFQHYALFRHMTLIDNVAFGLRVRGVAKEERLQKARELIELVGLKGFENRMPPQLSGGQRQRVALARALAPEPKLLLLDEPFGALDTRLRKELRAWLKELHDRIGLTTLLVTHDQEEAFDLSDRILVINQGRVEQEATPMDIFDRPASEFVASFVGETNRVEGPVVEGSVAWGPFRFKAVSFKEGQKAVALFRPGDVYVTRHREQGGWPGKIRSIRFLGATEVLDIEISENHILTAHIPKGVAKLSGFCVDETVYVMVTESHVFAG